MNTLRSKIPAGWIGKGAIALVAMAAFMLPACADNQRQATSPQENAPTQEETRPNDQSNTSGESNIERTAENPNQLIGQTITIDGEVENVYNPRLFTVKEEKVFGADKVLVINPQAAAAPQDNRDVKITGEVRKFVLADFERDYNLTWEGDVRQEIEAEYQNKPVIVAQSIQLPPE